MTDIEHLVALEKASANPRDEIAVYVYYSASIYSIDKYFGLIRFVNINF